MPRWTTLVITADNSRARRSHATIDTGAVKGHQRTLLEHFTGPISPPRLHLSIHLLNLEGDALHGVLLRDEEAHEEPEDALVTSKVHV